MSVCTYVDPWNVCKDCHKMHRRRGGAKTQIKLRKCLLNMLLDIGKDFREDLAH